MFEIASNNLFMKKFTIILVFILGFVSIFPASCTNKSEQADNLRIAENSEQKRNEVSPELQNLIQKLEPFFEPMNPPEPDEWLATFKENGQTFVQYINQNPTLPTEQRQTLYIQPLGKFNAKQLRVIAQTAEFLGLFYDLPVKTLPVKKFDKPLSMKNTRDNPSTRQEQVRTGYILDEILKPILPDDAAALIAFTNEDLYPDKNFNYVFGQATLENRVGVWSLYRLRENVSNNVFLLRTLKIAAHEVGHMFSMHHCAKYECLMSGTNHLGETDSRPVDACPECTAKILWMKKQNAPERFKKLSAFFKNAGLSAISESFSKKAEAVR